MTTELEQAIETCEIAEEIAAEIAASLSDTIDDTFDILLDEIRYRESLEYDPRFDARKFSND